MDECSSYNINLQSSRCSTVIGGQWCSCSTLGQCVNNSSTVDVFGSVSVMKSHMSVLLVKLQLLSCVLLVCVCVCVCV